MYDGSQRRAHAPERCSTPVRRYEKDFTFWRRLRYDLSRGVNPSSAARALAAQQPPLLTQALRRSVTSRDGRLILIKNYKAACTTCTQLLHAHDHGSFWRAHDIHGSPVLRQGLRHAPHHLAALARPDTIRFTFVREPAARLLSGFLMFFGTTASSEVSYRAEPGLAVHGFDPLAAIDHRLDAFLSFLGAAFEVAPRHVNPHWRRQVLNTCHGSIDYTHIGRVETFTADMRRIAELAGSATVARLAGDVQFNARSNAIDDSVVLSARQRALCRDLFAADYAAFGY